MIIAHRPAPLRFGTDAVAQNLHSVITVPALRIAARLQDEAAAGTGLDLDRLYPNLFAAPAPAPLGRVNRAIAFRLSVLGTAAVMMLALLHH